MDITHCVGGVTNACVLSAKMEITICVDPVTFSMEVTFKEMLIVHDLSCVFDVQLHYANGYHGDWSCEADVTYTAFINRIMPTLMTLLGISSDCEFGNETVRANYVKQMCVVPCTSEINGWDYMQLVPCEESVACCIDKVSYCIDEEGVLQSTHIGNFQTGECSEGVATCRSALGEPYSPTIVECNPRSCTNIYH